MRIQILGPMGRNENIARHLSIKHEVAITEDVVSLVELERSGTSFLISNGYAPILKKPVIDRYRKRIINIHPAYLPDGRGIYSNFWSFFERFPQEATIHYIDEGIDTGEILLRERVYPNKDDTLRTTLRRLMCVAEKLFIDNSDAILSGELKSISQDSLRWNSFYHDRLTSESFVELLPETWNTNVREVMNLGDSFAFSTHCTEQYLGKVKSLET